MLPTSVDQYSCSFTWHPTHSSAIYQLSIVIVIVTIEPDMDMDMDMDIYTDSVVDVDVECSRRYAHCRQHAI